MGRLAAGDEGSVPVVDVEVMAISPAHADGEEEVKMDDAVDEVACEEGLGLGAVGEDDTSTEDTDDDFPPGGEIGGYNGGGQGGVAFEIATVKASGEVVLHSVGDSDKVESARSKHRSARIEPGQHLGRATGARGGLEKEGISVFNKPFLDGDSVASIEMECGVDSESGEADISQGIGKKVLRGGTEVSLFHMDGEESLRAVGMGGGYELGAGVGER